MKKILHLGYVKDAYASNYNLDEEYKIVSAKDSSIKPDHALLNGIDIGLLRLHIHNAPERRKWLGLKEDKQYEIMVSMSVLHIYGDDVIKPTYSKFFNVDKENSAGGFTYKKMFENLKPKNSLNIDVKLVEIDNNKVDPDPLEELLKDTGIGSVLDLAPYNPKQYILLASNIINKIQEVFGSDKVGDDLLWDDILTLEAKPTIPGAYRLKEGFYVIIEDYNGFNFNDIIYKNNTLYKDNEELKTNYMVFSIGKSIQ